MRTCRPLGFCPAFSVAVLALAKEYAYVGFLNLQTRVSWSIPKSHMADVPLFPSSSFNSCPIQASQGIPEDPKLREHPGCEHSQGCWSFQSSQTVWEAEKLNTWVCAFFSLEASSLRRGLLLYTLNRTWPSRPRFCHCAGTELAQAALRNGRWESYRDGVARWAEPDGRGGASWRRKGWNQQDWQDCWGA